MTLIVRSLFLLVALIALFQAPTVNAQDVPRPTPCKKVEGSRLSVTPNKPAMMSVTQLPDMGPQNPQSGAFIPACLWSKNGHWALMIHWNGEWAVHYAETPFSEITQCCHGRGGQSHPPGLYTLLFTALGKLEVHKGSPDNNTLAQDRLYLTDTSCWDKPNGNDFDLIMQDDGNLVVYDMTLFHKDPTVAMYAPSPLWSTRHGLWCKRYVPGKDGDTGCRLVPNNDGGTSLNCH